jgi:hypothetical protein
MRWVLTHPQGVGPALAKAHALKYCLPVIGETREVDRKKRLSIYGNGYFWRIIEVLGSTFSSVKNVLGDDFYDVARGYLVKHPSTFRSIDDIGAHMADFLKTRPVARHFPFLSDLAAVEWATHQAFFADDAPRFDAIRLQKISPAVWPKVRVQLHPAVRLLKVHWPVDALWRDDGAWKKSRLRRLPKGPLYLLVYRLPENFVRAARIDSVQHRLLTHLQQGFSLGKALAKLPRTAAAVHELSALENWFQTWGQNGIIRAIRSPASR